MEERGTTQPKESEQQRRGKQAKVVQTRFSSEGAVTKRRDDHQVEVPAWTPSLVLDGAPLPSDAFVKDF